MNPITGGQAPGARRGRRRELEGAYPRRHERREERRARARVGAVGRTGPAAEAPAKRQGRAEALAVPIDSTLLRNASFLFVCIGCDIIWACNLGSPAHLPSRNCCSFR